MTKKKTREEQYTETVLTLATMYEAIREFDLVFGDQKSITVRDLTEEMDLPLKHFNQLGKNATLKDMRFLSETARKIIWVIQQP